MGMDYLFITGWATRLSKQGSYLKCYFVNMTYFSLKKLEGLLFLDIRICRVRFVSNRPKFCGLFKCWICPFSISFHLRHSRRCWQSKAWSLSVGIIWRSTTSSCRMSVGVNFCIFILYIPHFLGQIFLRKRFGQPVTKEQ